jgi:hypothetical protein
VIKSFVLILHVMNPTGQTSDFAIDFGLTPTDCFDAAISWDSTLDAYSYMTCEIEVQAPAFSD